MSLQDELCSQIAAATGVCGDYSGGSAMGGGCISSAQRIECGGVPYFVKTNRAALADMFEAEARGLEEMRASKTVRVPEPVCWGVSGDTAYLVLEYLELGGSGSQRELGEGLAAMHRVHAPLFGWYRDNTIGSTPQINHQENNWVVFLREHRLGFQLELAARNGYGGRLQSAGERLLEGLPDLLAGHEPAPSMLHGDLWSGNYAFTRGGEPVIFDPAFYYGDRESDLAMTELFGGFGRDFYAAYNDAYALDAGYPVRSKLYRLYHVLNHLNLFGSGYHAQSQSLMDALLAEVG